MNTPGFFRPFNASSPPPIGDGIPAAITGTTLTATSRLLVDTGTNPAPGIAYSGDTNTGISIGTDTTSFIVNGGAFVTFNANGINTVSGIGIVNSFAGAYIIIDKTITAAGTTGARTINKAGGSVNFAAGATSLVVTNSLVTANSIVLAIVATNDGTLKSVQAVPTAGSFTLYANAAATAETRVQFYVFN